MAEIISSRENPNVKLYMKLAQKKHRIENNLFTLEGVRIIEDAFLSGAEFHILFVTEDFLSRDSSGIFDKISAEKTYIINSEIVSKISETKSPQGIFAVVKIPKKAEISEILKPCGKYLYLHNLQDSGNIGTIIRTADAFGIDGILTENCPDIYSGKITRSTMGSIFRVKICETNFATASEILAENSIKTFAAVIDKDATEICGCNFDSGACVLIGNEGNGLPREVSENCDEKLTIKMSGNTNSLNAAVAASIIIWELTK